MWTHKRIDDEYASQFLGVTFKTDGVFDLN